MDRTKQPYFEDLVMSKGGVRDRVMANLGIVQSEAQLQGQVVEYLKLRGLHFTHPPNGGVRDPRTAAKLRWQGVVPGVPDLLIFEPWADLGASGVGIALELKSRKGRLSEAQRGWLEWLKSIGWLVGAPRTFDEARAIIDMVRR
jgi:hypothetical protein